MNIEEVFRFNLKRIRDEKKVSQSQLAEKLGCAISYVSMLERGVRTPSMQFINLCAKALGVDPTELTKELANG
jgi:transcriptional regulator with XRE-family HTH domain